MDEIDRLDLEEIKRDVKRDCVITGPKAALFLLALAKEEGKGCRTAKSLFNKLGLHKKYELVVRRKRGPA